MRVCMPMQVANELLPIRPRSQILQVHTPGSEYCSQALMIMHQWSLL